ncbi:PREDICTED: probable ATP-dependent RNA helicase Dbp73D [Wasmannia auropunctata]|uniref:probable ATP-dependent RNA helicase Dbp73D n=1 Tax=Wasmannia auropunctata TaxID=64793 RepID=UPI0005EDF5FE|nr:PREDICTED: probable ATP-dependent RNA helicase Dbp73D [Wasmannia auropunctata]
MSLFVINRYEDESKEDNNETDHLSELLKRIEDRKRQRAAASNKSTLKDGNNLEEPKKKKKKKSPKAVKTDSHIEDQNARSEKNSCELAELISATDMNSGKTDKCQILQRTVEQMQHIRQQESSNSNAVQQMADCFVFTLNPDGRVVYVSDNIRKYTSHTKDDVLGKDIYNFIHQGDHNIFMSSLDLTSEPQSIKRRIDCRFLVDPLEDREVTIKKKQQRVAKYETMNVTIKTVSLLSNGSIESGDVSSESATGRVMCIVSKISSSKLITHESDLTTNSTNGDNGLMSIEDDQLSNNKVCSGHSSNRCVTNSSNNNGNNNSNIIETAEVSTKKKKKNKKKDIENEHHSVATDKNIVVEEKDENLTEENNNEDTTKKEVPLQSSFMVLGAKARKKPREVKRVLPDWLAHPEVISADLNSGPTLEEMESVLDAKLMEVLRANGIVKLFPVQFSVIKWLHKCKTDRKLGWWPRDTCVSAPTGSGKTLAYVLPIVQELQTRSVPKIRCLIVLPVQELAAQVHKVMVAYTSHTNLKVGLLSGAFPFEQEQNSIIKKTEKGKYLSTVDIVIATSGRLLDHILKTPGFSLDCLRFLVIDEADRATDWLQYLPEPHSRAPVLTLGNMRASKITPAQKLLFSATLSQDPEKLSRLGLFQPRLFTTVVTEKDTDVNLDTIAGDFVGRYTSPEELTELAVECSPSYKPIVLYQLLTRHDVIPKTLVFTNSGQQAHRLALLMQLLLSERNVIVGELSAQLASKQRESVLSRFAGADIHVLISSDALARGLDIPDVQLVVSYDIPKYIKGYIHRAGRTGRAGKPGTAVSILATNQVGKFKQMLSGAHKTVPNIERMELHATANAVNYEGHLEKLTESLEREKNKSLERTKAIKHRRVANVTKQNESVG